MGGGGGKAGSRGSRDPFGLQPPLQGVITRERTCSSRRLSAASSRKLSLCASMVAVTSEARCSAAEIRRDPDPSPRDRDPSRDAAAGSARAPKAEATEEEATEEEARAGPLGGEGGGVARPRGGGGGDPSEIAPISSRSLRLELRRDWSSDGRDDDDGVSCAPLPPLESRAESSDDGLEARADALTARWAAASASVYAGRAECCRRRVCTRKGDPSCDSNDQSAVADCLPPPRLPPPPWPGIAPWAYPQPTRDCTGQRGGRWRTYARMLSGGAVPPPAAAPAAPVGDAI